MTKNVEYDIKTSETNKLFSVSLPCFLLFNVVIFFPMESRINSLDFHFAVQKIHWGIYPLRDWYRDSKVLLSGTLATLSLHPTLSFP